MRGGAVKVTFTPSLSTGQYGELLRLVDAANQPEALVKILRAAAARWLVACHIDDCLWRD
jgi:hypothetical protein